MRSDHEVDLINAKLREKYGYIDERHPNFRVVWSNDQQEWRKGTFRDFYGSVFLREVFETRNVSKYLHFKDRWVLEKFFPVKHGTIPELPGITHSYEPLFVFHSASGVYLPPVYYVCEAIINTYLFSERKVRHEIDDEDAYNRELQKEADIIYDYLDDITPDMVSALEHGTAVSMAGLDAMKDKNERSDNHLDVPPGSQLKEAGVDS